MYYTWRKNKIYLLVQTGKQILIIIQQPELVGLVHCVISVIYVSPIYIQVFMCMYNYDLHSKTNYNHTPWCLIFLSYHRVWIINFFQENMLITRYSVITLFRSWRGVIKDDSYQFDNRLSIQDMLIMYSISALR